MAEPNPAEGASDGGSDGIVVTRPEPHIARITLSRAKARNALSIEVLRALKQAIDDLGLHDGIRAIVLDAEGPAFCAGHDLKELTGHRADEDGGRAFYNDTMRLCSEVMQGIVNCPKPVIAAVHGMATAAGCQLVASCDLAVAGEAARFCTPGVNIGLFCSTPMVALARNVPRKKAMEMLLLGEIISADEAAQHGLVNKVVPTDRVHEEAMAYARRIAAKSPATVAVGKAAFYHQIERPLSEAYDYAAAVMVDNMLYKDAEEGIGAFLEKREPQWKGC